MTAISASSLSLPAGVRARRKARLRHGSIAFIRFVARTVAIVVPVFLFATFITYALGAVSGLSPAGLKLGDAATPADVERVNAQFGLDQNVAVRYIDWLGGILRGDVFPRPERRGDGGKAGRDDPVRGGLFVAAGNDG